MSKVTLNNISNLQNENTAVTAINGNSTTIETAFDNTLSRDGSSPNQMEATLDMNSHAIINLPVPVNTTSPLRLQDLTNFNSGVSTLPPGGTTGQLLAKKSDTDYDVIWNFSSIGDMLKTTYDPTSVNSDVFNSANTYFKQTGTGSLQRSVSSKLKESLSVKDFGAVGDNVSDDTAAIQAAINQAQGTSVNVFFPPGTYKISSTINITNALSLFGFSRYSVSITWVNTTMTVFNITSDAQVKFEGLTFSGPLSATNGAVISLAGSATQNLFSTFRDCTFAQGFSHIVTSSAADWTVDNCLFSDFVQYGIYIANTYNADAGDSVIVNCTFSTTTTTSNPIYHVSSGGLKMLGNKIIGGSVGYNLNIAATGASTIDLIIIGNSIENQVNDGIQLQRLSGSNTFGNVVIVGNQISNMVTGIVTDANSGWLSRMTITGNQITLAPGNGSCISLGSPSNFLVSGNELSGQSGTTYGIGIGVGASNGQIGVNQYNNLTTPISNASTSVLVTQRTQKGSSSATTSAAAGSLFNGTVSVTFPVAFSAIPKVVCNTTSTGISTWASGVTKTGFTATVWALANSTAVPFDWIAESDA